MKKINKPNLDSEDIFEKCVNSFKDSTFSSKCAFLSLKENIKLSHDEYDKHGTSSTLHLFKQNNLLLSYTNENEDDFKKLYNSGLSNRKKADVYDFYIKIKSGFNNEREQRCAFCCIHRVSEVDHFLPKSKFKTLAIEPLNLLPICRDCNKEKGDFYSLEDKGIIHPYFDDVKQVWLYISFSMKESFLLTSITIENNNQIPFELFEKIKITAEKLKILESYKTYLIDDCDTIRTTLEGYSSIEECLIWAKSERNKRQKIMDINHPTRRLYECVVDYIAQFSDINSLLRDD